MIKGLAALLLGASAVAAQSCSDVGTMVGGFCACPSNTFPLNAPDNCDGSGICSTMSTVNPLASELVGFLEDHAIQNGNLTLKVVSPMRTGRLVENINLNGGCSYPGEYWTKSVDVCDDHFDSSIPFTNVFDCITFDTDTQEDEYFRYYTSLGFSVTDEIGELRGVPVTRYTSSFLAIEFSIRNLVSASLNNTIVNPNFDVEVVLTRQALLPSPPSLNLRFKTSTIFPYQISGGAFNTDNPLSLWEGNCQQAGECVQEWDVTLVVTRQCDFTGLYTLELIGACNDIGECPEGSLSNYTVDVNIVEANLCEVDITVVVDATGSLSSYSDIAMTVPKTAFVQGDRAYFLLALDSSLPIQSITFQFIAIEYDQTTVELVTDGAPGSQSSGAGLIIEQASKPGQASFSIALTVGDDPISSLFVVPDANDVFEFDVIVVAKVEYVGQFRRSTEQVEMTFRQHVTGIKRSASDLEGDASAIAPIAPVVLCGAAALAQANL